VDGVGVGVYCDQYFNQTSVHMTVATAFTIRNLAAGSHAITYTTAGGSPASDGNDRAHWHLTMVEVP
jgi:hypothetical protein